MRLKRNIPIWQARLLPRDRYQRVLFLLFICLLIASCIAPPYPDYLLMQHAPTVLAALILPWFANRFAMSGLSFSLIILFLSLHTLGARYLYSYVPYDAWTERMLGVNITEAFDFQRNHYDRLVHFSYGLLMVVPIQEFERRHLGLSAALASVLAIECILATSAAYELVEWGVSIVFAPDWADQFLGQQGDIFDAQKDMALATAGAIISIGALAIVHGRRARIEGKCAALCVAFIFASQTAVRASESSLVIEGCSVFDPESGKMLDERTIVVRGERIVAVAASEEQVDAPADATRIDGRGRFVLPGLIDAHVHLVHVLDYANVTGEEVLPLYLAAGVTSVRSAGDEIVAASAVAEFAAAHPQSSPRVFTCSPLLDGDPPIHPGAGRAITDPARVPALFDELRPWQVTTVKIYAGTGRDVGRAIIEEGRRRGLFVTAHLGAYSAQDAVADGIDGLEHIWSVFNYVIPAEAAAAPGHRGRLDLDNPLCTSLVAELARRKTYVDPTLVVFRNMILLPDVPEVRGHPDNLLVPRRLREFWPVYLQRSGCPQGGPLEDRRREFAKYQELTGRLYRAGVPLLVGTDSPEPHVTPGFSLHQELELLVASGLPPAAALRAATLHNATALGQQDHLGSIEVGKLADLVLLTANPLDDVRHTRQIELVIRGGWVCQPAELLQRAPKE